MTEPEEDQPKSRKTDDVLYSADGDPHHNLAEAPQPDVHLAPTYSHDGETEVLDGDE